MTFSNGLLVALFGMAVVFAVLVALSFFIRLESAVIGKIIAKQGKKHKHERHIEHPGDRSSDKDLMDSMSSELRLVNVDEDEAAAITAAVTETGRLSGKNLVVKSIKPYGLSLLNSVDGELRLFDVDDETAAVVIAAITNAGRALGKNLVVKSIKPLES